MKKINEKIEYLPASEEPLSADVILVHGDSADWIFDVGACDEAFELIQGLRGKRNVVLSHFHADHSSNLRRICYDKLYCGDFAAKKYVDATGVTSNFEFDDGVKITLFPIPSTHAKGSVGMLVDGTYAFLGDATYCSVINDKPCYNAGLLQALIKTLEKLETKYFCLSHETDFIKEKDEVLSELKSIYKTRDPHETYIYIERD